MAIKIDELNDILLTAGVKDQALRSAIIKTAEELEQDKKADKDEAPKKGKSKHVIFIRKDENGKYAEAGCLAKVPQDSDNNTLLSRIQTAAAQHNEGGGKKSNRGRKSKVGKIVSYLDFFSFCKRKFTKPVDIQPVKDLCEVIVLEDENIKFD